MSPPPTIRMLAHFQDWDDPRGSPATRHTLRDIVAMAVCAVMCGADTGGEVEAFGRAKASWGRSFLELPHGIPAHDTFGRVLAALAPDQCEAGCRSWVTAVVQATAGAVAGDGKTRRRAHDAPAGQDAVGLVSAWAAAHRLVLGQVAVAPGANELPAIPALVQQVAWDGCVVTVDAAGCQTAIAAQITAPGADSVRALKATQPTRWAAVGTVFREGPARGFAPGTLADRRTAAKNHGRREVRQVWAVEDADLVPDLDPPGAWPRLRRVVMVVAARRRGRARSRETRDSLSSLPGVAAPLGDAVRGHGESANRLHGVRDIAVRADERRVRHGSADQHLAVLRRLARNLLRQDPSAKMGTNAKRLTAGWDHAYLLKILES